MTSTPEKIDARGCSKCGEARRWTGSRWRCGPCYNAWQTSWKRDLPLERRASYAARQTATRRAWPEEQKAASRVYVAAWREANREYVRQFARDRYRANAEAFRAAKLAEYYANPQAFMARNLVRKARIKDAVCEHGAGCVTSEFLAGLYSQQCTYCDSAAQHADHFEPLATGGLHCRDNLVPACGPCNASKKASDPWEWMARRLS